MDWIGPISLTTPLKDISLGKLFHVGTFDTTLNKYAIISIRIVDTIHNHGHPLRGRGDMSPP